MLGPRSWVDYCFRIVKSNRHFWVAHCLKLVSQQYDHEGLPLETDNLRRADLEEGLSSMIMKASGSKLITCGEPI